MGLPLQSRKDGFIYFVIGLLTVRILLNFYGFDTVPFIGNNDEVITQDPAIYLARFGQFKALSFHGQLIDVIDSHYPPLFPWTQAILFHLAGFNEATVILPGIFYGCLSVVLLVYSLHLIASSGLTRLWISRIFMLVIIFDPSYLVLSRFGRVDTLANAFLSIALAMILLSYRNVHQTNFVQASSPHKADMSDPIELGRPWKPSLISGLKSPDFLMLLAALFIGLSLSTYTIHVYSFAFYIAFLLLIGRKYLRRSILILCSIVPLFTFMVLWFAAFKDDLVYSFFTHNIIASQNPPPSNILSTITVTLTNMQKFGTRGSILLLSLFAFLIGLACFITLTLQAIKKARNHSISIEEPTRDISKLTPAELQSWVYLGIFAFALQIVLIVFRLGLRLSGFFPITIIMAPVMISWLLDQPGFRFLTLALSRLALAAILTVNLIFILSYTKLVQSRLSTHSYQQVRVAISTLAGSVDKGILVPPAFWLAAHQQLPEKNIQIDINFIPKTPEQRIALYKDQNLDLLVVKSKSELEEAINKSGSGFIRSEKKFNIIGNSYSVYSNSDK
jgi:4-amino-4-deoxy-L-arabinose transferase-like glycosyltransferase